jgi:hypothetical protein
LVSAAWDWNGSLNLAVGKPEGNIAKALGVRENLPTGRLRYLLDPSAGYGWGG